MQRKLGKHNRINHNDCICCPGAHPTEIHKMKIYLYLISVRKVKIYFIFSNGNGGKLR